MWQHRLRSHALPWSILLLDICCSTWSRSQSTVWLNGRYTCFFKCPCLQTGSWDMASVPSSHLFSSDGEEGRGHSHTWLPQLSPAKVIVTLSSFPLLIHCFCIKFHFCCPFGFFFPPLAPLVGGVLTKTGGSYPLIKKTYRSSRGSWRKSIDLMLVSISYCDLLLCWRTSLICLLLSNWIIDPRYFTLEVLLCPTWNYSRNSKRNKSHFMHR